MYDPVDGLRIAARVARNVFVELRMYAPQSYVDGRLDLELLLQNAGVEQADRLIEEAIDDDLISRGIGVQT